MVADSVFMCVKGGNDSGSGSADKEEQGERRKKGIAFSRPGNKPSVWRLTRITSVHVWDRENAFLNLNSQG